MDALLDRLKLVRQRRLCEVTRERSTVHCIDAPCASPILIVEDEQRATRRPISVDVSSANDEGTSCVYWELHLDLSMKLQL